MTFDWSVVTNNLPLLLQGAGVTVVLTVVTMALAVPGGLLLAAASVVASGNDGWKDSISQPACISSAVSVGATTDTDAIASFSSIYPQIDLLAPGVDIVSSVPGGGVPAPVFTRPFASATRSNPAPTACARDSP